ncbi:MAG: ACP S-malonyltransferase [Deltaproteobacteria bacterium]|jgi:[acyl-carrier-protein] S-malonyltransferase|nr:ACP S-malonyltransferase [Deltaproteobacteria bacterium]MBW2222681.1 ACP S-malonyltransferase [Deltaproteobacteria bacterium]MBW2402219.1 ACP S-malonyltransferase [Deltaproteobacteria bacterium]MBW2545981.1 ACP S-malonyltransferase [Deltaproteobacteria bacterium]MBW2717093.1 ACP S-malonyltransferase [Deltaproteobacteria bacterium]
MIAWLVAGQGAEHPGMGLELARFYPPAATLWERASEAAGKDLLRVSEAGGPSLLRTEYLQPALTAVALAAASFLLNHGVEPSLALGHSAGEVGALALSGHLSFEEAGDLSAKRGRAMAGAARAQPGGMAAVHGSEARLDEVLELGGMSGAIFHAGRTSADTHLVAGEHAALRAAASVDGISLLPVSGPWHSPLMQDAVVELRPLAESVIGDACGTTAWLSNETAERGPADAREAVELLLSQLTRPMRLHRAIEFLLAEGASEIVVLGPDHSLHHILKRHLEKHSPVRIHGSSSLDELRTIVRNLA